MRALVLRIISRLLCVACLVNAQSLLASEPTILQFAISPQQSPGELGKQWVPFCQYLSKQTGYQIRYTTTKDLKEFWKKAEAGAFDFIYINPYYFLKAQKTAGYRAIAKDGGTPLVGIIVARSDGPQQIGELQEAKVATHDVSAFMTVYVQNGYLREQGVQIMPVGVGSLESVFLTIEKGLYPAGISIQRAFGLLDPAKQANFNVLWRSDPLPPFAYAVHPRVARPVAERVREALIGMGENAEGRALLSKLNIKSVLATKDSDFDSMRKLKLE